jgi:DNA-binding NarL/FixJ family response regulator
MREMLLNEKNEWSRDTLGSPALTKRQLEIAQLVAQGLPNKRIAIRLGVEVGTVKIHLHNIYQKLQISGRVRLAGLSRENPARVLDRTQQGEALAR